MNRAWKMWYGQKIHNIGKIRIINDFEMKVDVTVV